VEAAVATEVKNEVKREERAALFSASFRNSSLQSPYENQMRRSSPRACGAYVIPCALIIRPHYEAPRDEGQIPRLRRRRPALITA
jgi:hypothetical protein